MIIWQGFGFLVVLYTFIAALLGEYLSEKLTGNGEYYQHHAYPLSLALAVAAFATYLTARAFDKRSSKVFIDKETGRDVILKRTHSLFFIPMLYWSFILLIASVLVLIFK
jgi:hypothetical protein